MKIIGIATRTIVFEGKTRDYVCRSYLDILKAFGLIPLPLSLHSTSLFNLCSAFLIPGGGDIDPVRFQEKDEGFSKNVNPETDALDEAIVQYARENGLPLLGICRGMQAINVFIGGSIHQDIGSNHRHIISGHHLTAVPNRLLPFPGSLSVNSFHHQAVKALAPGLIPVARHMDGTVEAVVHEELPIIGIQWHPELLPDSPETQIIFTCFKKLLDKKNS